MKITIEALMQRHTFSRKGERLTVRSSRAIAPEEAEFIRANKAEILRRVDARDAEAAAAAAAHQAKLDAIEGLPEIWAAKADLERWHMEWSSSFEGDCGGLGVRPKPEYDFKALYAKYPRAAAYLKALEYNSAESYAKSAAGKKALNIIIDGGDYKAAIAQMENEWRAWCNRYAATR